jgi:hypothetical protein
MSILLSKKPPVCMIFKAMGVVKRRGIRSTWLVKRFKTKENGARAQSKGRAMEQDCFLPMAGRLSLRLTLSEGPVSKMPPD